jgi:exopolyphosphatase / guanosine-5'-triphosphate,3'-diphosphate pyrophosphatase
MSPLRAAIDIGTVSTRLLVADVEGESIREIVRHTCITHLGKGLGTTGRLSPEGVEAVFSVVSGFVEEARGLGVGEFAVAATSASRDAEDGPEFIAGLAALGIEPHVIAGSREAFLSFRGATTGLSEESVLVCDLGGGSTELILGSSVAGGEGAEAAVHIDAARSIDCGSRRVTDRFLLADPPTAAELEEARGWVTEEFRPYFDGLKDQPRSLVALAGTATTLSAISRGLVEYDPAEVHGSCLTGADLAGLRDELSLLTLEERKKVPGLDPARAGVIVAGALILETILALSGLDSAIVSEHDILYGLLLEGV